MRHGQWALDRVVEGYIAISLPFRQHRLDFLSSAKEREVIGQEISEKIQAIERFDLFVDHIIKH